jgi:cytochrome d ubiquinol oxidase subunit II
MKTLWFVLVALMLVAYAALDGFDNGLTIYNSQTGAYSLGVGLVWWLAGMLLAVGYFTFLYRSFRGKVSLNETGAGGGY